MEIQTVTSPGGIEAWLVEEHAVPMLAMRFAFEGGSSQDSTGKEGLANFVAAMLDKGAGNLDAVEFRERLEDLAARVGFKAGKDVLTGSLETLTENLSEAAQLLRLSLAWPRFAPDAVEHVRQRLLVSVAQAHRDPSYVAMTRWDALAFAGHAYARPVLGSEATISKIKSADLAAYHRRVFAKDTLKVVAVGDIAPDELGTLLDEVFGDLPASADLIPVARTEPVAGGLQAIVDMDVSQSAVAFGLGAVPHDDPDYVPACVLNHIIGGGGIVSRFFEEVRSKRGLAFSVWTDLKPARYASVLRGGVASRNDTVGATLDVIRAELQKMAEGNFSETDLETAKSCLIGAYPLRFDANAKIALQLLGFYTDGFGPDYVDDRNAMIAEVTLEDMKRVAMRILDTDNLIVTIVGRPVLQPAATA